MKQKILPRQTIRHKISYNNSYNRSLKILEYSNEELIHYLKTNINNPLIEISCPSYDKSLEDIILNYEQSTESLYDYLMDQLRFCNKKYDLLICRFLILNLDSNGYFRSTKDELIKQCECSQYEFNYHLNLLRSLEPYGICSFSLADCLKIQCKMSVSPYAKDTYILCDYLEDIAKHRTDKILKSTSFSSKQLQNAMNFLLTLNPKPAAGFSSNSIFMIPEFKIINNNGTLVAQPLNSDFELHIDSNYKDLLKQERSEAEEIMNAIQKRNFTLIQIIESILRHQKNFFLYHQPLHHLTLEMISSECGLHVSTISRAINAKSIEFENHYYSMKKFLVSRGNGIYSSTELKEKIRNIINNEDKKHPLSDENISNILKHNGVDISRRLVSKYRENMMILNSRERKITHDI